MKSRWRTTCGLDAGSQYLVLASSIPPRSRRSTWRLFREASATEGQLANTEGLIAWRQVLDRLIDPPLRPTATDRRPTRRDRT